MHVNGRIVAIETHTLSPQQTTYTLELYVSNTDTRLLRISQQQFQAIKQKGLGRVRLQIDRNSGFVETIDYL